jgi:hypothetical protein
MGSGISLHESNGERKLERAALANRHAARFSASYGLEAAAHAFSRSSDHAHRI